MNIPPIRTALFNSLLLFTVMNLTANCGCAIAPIPTPIIIDVTRFHQNTLPILGNVVHPVAPVAFALSGNSGAIFARNVCASVMPPSNQYILISKTSIPKNIITP